MKVLFKVIHVLLATAILSFAHNTYAINNLEQVRIFPSSDNSRIIFDVKSAPEYSYFSLTNPQRLVIDFKNSKNSLKLSGAGKHDNRIHKIRTSTSKTKSATRLVLELKSTYKVNLFTLAPSGKYGHRLVVDLVDLSAKKSTPTVVKKAIVRKPPAKPIMALRDTIIGIDAGHGGKDPGSIGPKGTYEKLVTLAISKKLETLINREKGMKAVMIRSGDYFVNLDRRTNLARSKEVDFLVSIHADAFRTSQPNGASVWVVSNKRAQSELSRYLDNRQRNSELLGGGGEVIKTTKDDNLALTLADMNREHSLAVSIGIADNVLGQLRKITKLHKKTTQYKSLAVLKSSDIPSVLVETGFISNHQEERNLRSSAHQQKLASAIHQGIKSYFIEHPLANSYLASVSYRKHKVSSGESLSVLAQRYNVSVGKIKSVNRLTSNTVRIGQTLKIPRA